MTGVAQDTEGRAREAGEPAADGRAFRFTVGDTGLAEIVLDVPGKSVNTFDSSVMAELEALLGQLAADERITVAVFSSAKAKGFVAGADVAEIAAVVDADDAHRKVMRGQKVFLRLARLPFPTLAVIHGACLGGGLEMTLACTHRIAAPDAELGLPEVRLGIIPGWGGTQRLPRLVGPRAAIDLICSGRRIDGKEALRIGLVDRLAPAHELRARALAFARDIAATRRAAGGGRARLPATFRRGRESDRRSGGAAATEVGSVSAPLAGRSSDRSDVRDQRPSPLARLQRFAMEANPAGRRVVFGQARKRILAQTGGHYPAPLLALQAIEQGLEGSFEAGLTLEGRLVSELLVSPVSKNLVHVFGLLEGVKKSPWAQAAADAPPVERAAVLGAGIMGGQIACLLASAGIWVRLKDIETVRVAQGLRAAREVLAKRLRRRKLDEAGLRRAMSRIAGTTDDSGLGRAQLVIEAIVEDLEVKKRVFARLDSLAPADAILTTNTSSLPVGEIGAPVRDAARVAGLHFFNPVDRMPLVEVVRARDTSPATVSALYALALRLDKKPVVVKDTPGFLVNRILMPYLNEAAQLYAAGIEATAIDGAMTAFGMPVGPLALLDDIGLDVAYKVGRILAQAFPGRMEPAPLFEALHATGRTGRKGGRGFYLYEHAHGLEGGFSSSEGFTRAGPDPYLRQELWGRADEPGSSHPGRTPVVSGPSALEIEHRLVYPMIDEAARCLAEGVVETAGEVDLALIAGTGFPPFRGGLLRYADAVGVGAVFAVLQLLAVSGAPRLAPSAELREVAARGGFYGDGQSRR